MLRLAGRLSVTIVDPIVLLPSGLPYGVLPPVLFELTQNGVQQIDIQLVCQIEQGYEHVPELLLDGTPFGLFRPQFSNLFDRQLRRQYEFSIYRALNNNKRSP